MGLEEPELTGPDGDEEEFRPVGTVAFLVFYAVVLVALWTAMYLTMLARGGTS